MSNLKIAFFTEAGKQRGMGHLIRCYTIYDGFKIHSHSTDFFLDSDINFDYKFNDIKYFTWNTLTLNSTYDIIFVDSYIADIHMYNKLSNSTKLLVSIDDYSRLSYPKGIILNFAPDAEESFFKKRQKEHHYFLGMKYIPIRRYFIESKYKKQEKQIFIMLGGTDVANLSLEIIDALQNINIKKTIVINNKNNIEKIKKYTNVKILYKPTDTELIDNMKNSNIAITTASMSLYELNHLQIPTIIFTVAKNQILGALQSIKYGIAFKYIDIQLDYKEILIEYINFLNYNPIKVKQHVDDKGVERIINQTIRLVKK